MTEFGDLDERKETRSLRQSSITSLLDAIGEAIEAGKLANSAFLSVIINFQVVDDWSKQHELWRRRGNFMHPTIHQTFEAIMASSLAPQRKANAFAASAKTYTSADAVMAFICLNLLRIGNSSTFIEMDVPDAHALLACNPAVMQLCYSGCGASLYHVAAIWAKQTGHKGDGKHVIMTSKKAQDVAVHHIGLSTRSDFETASTYSPGNLIGIGQAFIPRMIGDTAADQAIAPLALPHSIPHGPVTMRPQITRISNAEHRSGVASIQTPRHVQFANTDVTVDCEYASESDGDKTVTEGDKKESEDEKGEL